MFKQLILLLPLIYLTFTHFGQFEDITFQVPTMPGRDWNMLIRGRTLCTGILCVVNLINGVEGIVKFVQEIIQDNQVQDN